MSRPPLRARGPERYPRRHRLAHAPQSRLAQDHPWLRRTRPARPRAEHARAVRTHRLLLRRRQGLPARQARLQPYRRPEGLLGEGRSEIRQGRDDVASVRRLTEIPKST